MAEKQSGCPVNNLKNEVSDSEVAYNCRCKWSGGQTAFVSRPGQQLYPLANLPEINEKNILLIAKKLFLFDI